MQNRIQKASDHVKPSHRKALLMQATRSTSAAKKIHWLRREADLLNEAVQPHTACSSGCSHCCHIGVLVAEPEARVIAKELGMAVKEPPAERLVSVAGALHDEDILNESKAQGKNISDHFFGQPCTFLKDGACSIYDFRPLACRQLFNADVDDLLCRLVEGETIPVPYVNMQSSQIFYVGTMGFNTRMADIRDWLG